MGFEIIVSNEFRMIPNYLQGYCHSKFVSKTVVMLNIIALTNVNVLYLLTWIMISGMT